MQEQCRLITKEQLDYYKGLEKKLEIATKALKLYSDENNWFGYDAFEIFEDGMPKYKDKDIAKEALKQIEELDK